MHCYYHPPRPAVAICTSCSRGLCSDCAADVPNATACRNRCEDEAIAIKEVMERNKTGYQKAAGLQVRNAIIYLLMAVVVTAIGLLTLPSGWVMVGFGVVLLVAAALSYSSGKKLERVA